MSAAGTPLAVDVNDHRSSFTSLARANTRIDRTAKSERDCSRRTDCGIALSKLRTVVIVASGAVIGAVLGTVVWGVIGNLCIETHHFSGMWYMLLLPVALILGSFAGALATLGLVVGRGAANKEERADEERGR